MTARSSKRDNSWSDRRYSRNYGDESRDSRDQKETREPRSRLPSQPRLATEIRSEARVTKARSRSAHRSDSLGLSDRDVPRRADSVRRSESVKSNSPEVKLEQKTQESLINEHAVKIEDSVPEHPVETPVEPVIKAETTVAFSDPKPAPIPTHDDDAMDVDKPVIKEEQVDVNGLEDEDDGTVWSDDEFPVADGCIFPMRKAPYAEWDLRNVSKKQRRKGMKYFSHGRCDSLHQYSFFEPQLLRFLQTEGPQLFQVLQSYHHIIDDKKAALKDEFLSRTSLWNTRTKVMDEQLEHFANLKKELEEGKKPTDKKSKELAAQKAAEDARLAKEAEQKQSRRTRHHGDSVRTEAEFLDILASFERERQNDPMVRAQYGAATLPNMILDPVQKCAMARFMNSNNLVRDKKEWAHRIETDPMDNFTEAEHQKFCKGFVLHPKKFGRISHYMGGLRTPEECVLHYYTTKKRVDYKEMVSHKKRGQHKGGRKKKTKKGQDSAQASPSVTDSPDVSIVSEPKLPSGRLMMSKQLGSKRAAQEPAIPNTPVTPKTPKTANESENNTPSVTPAPVDEPTSGNEASMEESVVKKESVEAVPSLATIESIAAAVAAKETKTEPEPPKRGRRGRKRSREASDDEQHRDKRKERGHKDKSHITSYWSVQDTNQFPKLLEQHGTDWESISKALGSKTSSMVRNYYQRGLNTNPQWKDVAATADRRSEETGKSETEQPAEVVKTEPAKLPESAPAVISPVAAPVTSPPGIRPVSVSPATNPVSLPPFSPPSVETTSSELLPPAFPATAPNVMRMSALLNVGSAAPSPVQSAPLPQLQSDSQRGKPTIMSLLNGDAMSQNNYSAATTSAIPAIPAGATIGSITNQARLGNFGVPPSGTQQRATSGSPPPQETDPMHPSQQRHTGGFSALEALAQVAFEKR